MIAPTKLIALTIGTTGIIGGGASALYFWGESSISIEEKLKKENKKILTDTNEERWGIKLNTYTTELKKSDSGIKLGGSGTWSDLKNWCEKEIKKSSKEISTKVYEGIQKICTVPTNKEKFKKDSKALAGQEDWEKKKTLYQKEGTEKNVIEGINKENIADGNGIKDWCSKEIKEEYAKDDDNYKRALKWCTKNGK